jgi:hypothetical protein
VITDRDNRPLGRSAARGAIAAMAMTGMRRVTSGLGLLQQAPPEMIAEEGVPHLLDRIPEDYRDEAIELAHWAYGAAAGAAFAALPAAARRHWLAGPLYGLAVWLVFETGVAPVFGLSGPGQWRVSDRVAVAADHVLYGVVVAARPRRV